VTGRWERTRRAIEDALGRCGTPVAEAAGAAWSVGGIRVRWEDPWLSFTASANGAAGGGRDAAWELLRGQGSLPAACRYALATSGEWIVVGEVAAGVAPDLDARCAEIVAGLGAARTARPPAPPAVVATGERAGALVAEIGWDATRRPDGRLAGRLPDLEPSRWAEASGDGTGGVRLSVEIASFPAPARVTRHALVDVLLAAGRFVRYARPGIEERDADCAVRFETRLASDATAAELRHALAALSVACHACADEVSVLGDEIVAKEFLAVRGESS